MVCYFVGGAIGSLTAGMVLAAAGWYGICWLGAGFGLLLNASALLDHVRPRDPGRPDGERTSAGSTAGSLASRSQLGPNRA
jgi:hypothetical protein